MAKKTNAKINGKEYYRLRVTIGKDKNGKDIVKNFYGSSKKDAEKQKEEWLRENRTGDQVDLSDSLTMAMHEWLWEEVRFSGIKPSTFERYEGVYRNYIEKSPLGYMRLEDIKKINIKKYYNNLYTDDKTYSQIRNVHKLINMFFIYMVNEGYLPTNPCSGLKLDPYKQDEVEELEEGKVETFSPAEITSILESIENDKLRILVKLAIGTGLRLGELLALEKGDVNDNLISVTKTVKNIKVFDDEDNYHYREKVSKPKTKKSIRKVPIPSKLEKDLIELNKIRLMEKLKLGELYKDIELLFPSSTGTHINSRNLTRSWQRAFKNIDVPYKKFHSLRHTFATQLLKNGAQLIEVSRLLGHSSIKTTEIYAHVLEETKVNQVEKLNVLFK